MNGETHVEHVAMEIKRTKDKKGTIRHSAFCPMCKTRAFINGWVPRLPGELRGPPHSQAMNLIQAKQTGLQVCGVSPYRVQELAAELGYEVREGAHLGLQQVLTMQPAPVGLPGPRRRAKVKSRVKSRPKGKISKR